MVKEKEVFKRKKLKKWLKVLLVSLGIFSICLGFIGVFVPILPTTPFILLSAALFARSSEKFYSWLIGNRLFGRYIKNYREGRGVSSRIKISAILILWLTIGFSIVFGVEILWVRILLVLVATGVTVHIVMIKKSG